MDFNDLQNLAEAYNQVNQQLDEAEGSYGETPKAYSAASKTKMTAKRKPFLKKMLRRTNPAERRDSESPRKGMTADDRERARAGSAHGVGTRQDHDYPSEGPGGVTKNPKKLRKQKAMGEFAKEDFELWVDSLLEEGYDLSEYTWEEMYDIYEAEGSYGKTPKAREAMGKLAIARREKPASEYSQKGEKTKKVKAIEKHTRRIDNGPDAGHSGKKSTSPRWSGYLGAKGRGKMDQDSRDWSRERDVEYSAGENKPGPGTVTKNPKKLRKQRAMGEIAKEDFDTYEFVLSYLLEEGYASTEQAADKIILSMSEAWFEDIIEARRSEKEGKGSPEYKTASGQLVGQRGERKRKGEMGGRHFWSGGEGGSNMERGAKKVKGAKEDENKYTQHGRTSVFQGRTEKSGKYSAMQSRKRGSEMGSRFD